MKIWLDCFSCLRLLSLNIEYYCLQFPHGLTYSDVDFNGCHLMSVDIVRNIKLKTLFLYVFAF